MIEHTFQVLGYYRLLNILSHYASCSLGQSDCLSLKPSNDTTFIDNELKLVSEMKLLLKVKGFVSFSHVTDILPILRKSGSKGSCLEPNEFLSVLRLTEAGQQSRKLLRSEQTLCPKTYALVKKMPGCEALVKEVRETISSRGEIKDSASHTLKKIREKKVKLRIGLQKRLEGIQKTAGLSLDGHDYLVTVRDGRYVIPLRTDQQWRIKGIVHDYSRTRSTCFFEPVDVIQDNNRMAELSQEEQAEVHRILSNLTTMVDDSASDLQHVQTLITRLDGLRARAKFSEELSCVMPELDESPCIELKKAKNPILLALTLGGKKKDKRPEDPVPVDILLDANHNVLIISGPNRGGKTVTLKTLGLMSLMTQSGIHIPAEEGSRLPVFDHIIADIGDDQDIQTGLSTFSAHANHLRYLTEHADQNSLIIIDEPGMGTDPDEGVALAMAVLDFLSQQGTFVAVSTHLNRLKTYGVLSKRAVNASVEFDAEKNRPTFKLRYGAPGISHAMEVARDMGVSSHIIDRAKRYLDRDEVRLNRLIEKLNHLIVETDNNKREAENIKKKYNAAKRKIKERLITLETEKRAVMEAKRIEAESAIKEARQELKDAVRLLKQEKAHAQSYVTRRYDEVSEKLLESLDFEVEEPSTGDAMEIAKGQLVYHKKLRQKGIVQSLDPSGWHAMVMLGKVKISARVQDLEVVQESDDSGLQEVMQPLSWGLEGALIQELNVIGYRIDDALPLIDKAIDRALVEGEFTLRIIHGFGTGRLRQAIRAHLKEAPFVKRISSADPSFGGDAITIVELS